MQHHVEEGPGTYCRGSNPIDEIIVSDTLDITKCGCLSNGNAAGDH